MTRVALVNLASLPMPANDPIYPVGLNLIRNSLERAGHDVTLIDFVENEEWCRNLGWAAEPWDVLAFSIRNIDPIDLAAESHVPHYVDFVGRLLEAVGPQRPVIAAGGAGYSLFADALVSLLPIDVGIVGPGEEVFLGVAADPERYRGLRHNITGVQIPQFCRAAHDGPTPLLRAYAGRPAASIGIETRRATCYQKCVYCPYAHISGRSALVAKSGELLRTELEAAYEAGFRHVFFTDGVFNAELRLAKRIVADIARWRPADLHWSAYFAPHPFDAELAELLAAGGLDQLVLSPDSLDDEMMGRLGKRFRTHQLTRALDLAREHALRPQVVLMLGGPGEDRETVRRSAAYANLHLGPRELQINIGVRVLPHTPLATALGLTHAEMLSPVFHPFDEEIFDWVLRDFDGRFFELSDYLRFMAWKGAVRTMIGGTPRPGGDLRFSERVTLHGREARPVGGDRE